MASDKIVRLTLVGIDSELTVDVPDGNFVLSEGTFADPLEVQYVTTVKVPYAYTVHKHEYNQLRSSLIPTSSNVYKVCSAQIVDKAEYTIDPELRTSDSVADGCESCVMCKGTYLSYARVFPA